MRIFYATDLHGSEVCFRKFINAGKFYEADVLICGGDITGKMLVPIIKKKDGSYEATYYDEKVAAHGGEELDKLIKTLRNIGFYYVITDEEEIKTFTKEKVDEIFRREMINTLKSWLALAEQRLKPAGIQCYMMPGNDDIYEIDKILDDAGYVKNANERICRIGPFEMLTLGFANITPWNCIRDIPEKRFADEIEKLASQVKNMDRCIFNIHCPPYDSEIDVAPQLDENFKPKMQGGELKMVPVGSKAVRRAIEKYQPLVSLNGHIHEGRGTAKIGRTTVINPGSEYQQNILRGVVLELNEKKRKIKKVLTDG